MLEFVHLSYMNNYKILLDIFQTKLDQLGMDIKSFNIFISSIKYLVNHPLSSFRERLALNLKITSTKILIMLI